MTARVLKATLFALAVVLVPVLLAAKPAAAAFLTPEYQTTLTGAGGHVIGEALAVAVDEETHDLYVADRANQRIEKFDSAGNFLFNFDEGVHNPSAIAVDNSDGSSKGAVYVAEGVRNGGNGSISKFDSAGNLITAWGDNGRLSVDQLLKITVSYVDGTLWAIDDSDETGPTSNSVISSYTSDGIQRFRIEQGRDGGTDGTFAVDADGRLWFADHNQSPLITDLAKVPPGGHNRGGIFALGQATHFAADPFDGDILAVFNGGEVAVFEASCDPTIDRCQPKESFGAGNLSEPKGLATDGSTGSVYVAIQGGVAVFRSKVIPDITPKPSSVGLDDAVVTAHLDPAGAGDITGCVVDFGPTKAYGTTVPCDQQLPLSAASDATVHLSNLSTEQPYHFRFRATNGNGTTDGPDRVVTAHWVKGLETNPATDIGPGTAILHGELDPEGQSTHYYFEWGAGEGYGQRTPALPGNETSVSGPTLVEASLAGVVTSTTTYHFRLVAVNALGTSYGADREFTTPLGEPPQIGAVSATPTGPTTAALAAQVNPSFADTAFRFQYGTQASYGNSTLISVSIGNDGTFHNVGVELSDLEPSTTYHLRLIAFNFVGHVMSSDVTFTTPAVSSTGQGSRLGADSAPPSTAPSSPRSGRKRPIGKCKKGFVRKKGKCVKKQHTRRKPTGGQER